MKIGVSAQGGSMESEVEPRFGRCPYFLIVDSDTMEFEAFPNSGTRMAHGAGPRTVQEFVQRGTEVVLTGQVGPKAQQALDAASLEVVTGTHGTVREAIEAYLARRATGT
jgi:predicted Fe-Mo cluster-binding NifX family protein